MGTDVEPEDVGLARFQAATEFRGRLLDAVFAVTSRAKVAREALLVPVECHLFEREGDLIMCVGHFNAIEEQHSWPCGEIEKLAGALKVALPS